MSAYKVLILGLISLSLFAELPEAVPRCASSTPFPDARKKITDFDSLNCRFVGNWPFGPSYAVAYDSARSLVFCGSGGGVYVLDVLDPYSPRKISEAIHTRGIVEGLFYVNNYLFIADGEVGLEIWDVTNQSIPFKLTSYITPGYASCVYVSGDYAYVANRDSGLRIIDISDPAEPFEVGFYVTSASFYNTYIQDSFA